MRTALAVGPTEPSPSGVPLSGVPLEPLLPLELPLLPASGAGSVAAGSGVELPHAEMASASDTAATEMKRGAVRSINPSLTSAVKPVKAGGQKNEYCRVIKAIESKSSTVGSGP